MSVSRPSTALIWSPRFRQGRRLQQTRSNIRGWAADLVGQGKPLTVLIFANGRNMLGTQTKGPRHDVAQALKLSEPAAANVAFEGEFS